MTFDRLRIGENPTKALITIIPTVVALVGVAGRNFLSVQFMKTNLNLLPTRIFCAWALGIGSFFSLAAVADVSVGATPATTTAIPWSQLGAMAGIDPTFSDANWSSMGGTPGTDNHVYAAVVDDAGNLYVGGEFTLAGEVIASCIAGLGRPRQTSKQLNKTQETPNIK